MNIDENKVDEVVLALLYLTRHQGNRAWKSLDWEAMDRLFRKGFIHDPFSKAKSVVFTHDGLNESARLCQSLFAEPTPETTRQAAASDSTDALLD